MSRTPEQLARHRAWMRDFNCRNKDRINREKRDRMENPGKHRAKAAARKKKIKQRTPAWANLKKIERVYQLCVWASRFTDEPLHVDHIAPLCGETISGLHVAENLQILPASENCSKSNAWGE